MLSSTATAMHTLASPISARSRVTAAVSSTIAVTVPLALRAAKYSSRLGVRLPFAPSRARISSKRWIERLKALWSAIVSLDLTKEDSHGGTETRRDWSQAGCGYCSRTLFRNEILEALPLCNFEQVFSASPCLRVKSSVESRLALAIHRGVNSTRLPRRPGPPRCRRTEQSGRVSCASPPPSARSTRGRRETRRRRGRS